MSIRHKLLAAMLAALLVPLAAFAFLAARNIDRTRADLRDQFLRDARASFELGRSQSEALRREDLIDPVHELGRRLEWAAPEEQQGMLDEFVRRTGLGPVWVAWPATSLEPGFAVPPELKQELEKDLAERVVATAGAVPYHWPGTTMSQHITPCQALERVKKRHADAAPPTIQSNFLLGGADESALAMPLTAGGCLVVSYEPRQFGVVGHTALGGWTYAVDHASGQLWTSPDDAARLHRELPHAERLGATGMGGGDTATVRVAHRNYFVYKAPSWEVASSLGAVDQYAVIPADVLFAPLRRLVYQSLGAILGSLLISLLLAALLSRRFLSTIERIEGMVGAVSGGDYRHLEALSQDELGGRLVAAVNRMVTGLATRQQRQEVASWRRFIRVLSHEVNNTLGPVRSVAATLRDQIAVRVEQDDAGRDLRQGAGLIVDRVDALSAFLAAHARLAQLGEPRRVEIDVNHLVAGSARMFQERAAAGAITIELGLDARLTACAVDPTQLERVVINLVQNAVEAAARGGHVWVRTVCGPGQLEIVVEDDGPGLHPEARRHLFVPSFTTKRGGSGIGLALVHQIVVGHGGTVSAENRAEGGARFRVVLPAHGGAARDERPHPYR